MFAKFLVFIKSVLSTITLILPVNVSRRLSPFQQCRFKATSFCRFQLKRKRMEHLNPVLKSVQASFACPSLNANKDSSSRSVGFGTLSKPLPQKNMSLIMTVGQCLCLLQNVTQAYLTKIAPDLGIEYFFLHIRWYFETVKVPLSFKRI